MRPTSAATSGSVAFAFAAGAFFVTEPPQQYRGAARRRSSPAYNAAVAAAATQLDVLRAAETVESCGRLTRPEDDPGAVRVELSRHGVSAQVSRLWGSMTRSMGYRELPVRSSETKALAAGLQVRLRALVEELSLMDGL